jgi:hypothetical protein
LPFIPEALAFLSGKDLKQWRDDVKSGVRVLPIPRALALALAEKEIARRRAVMRKVAGGDPC